MYHSFHNNMETADSEAAAGRGAAPRQFSCPYCGKRSWRTIETFRIHKSHCRPAANHRSVLTWYQPITGQYRHGINQSQVSIHTSFTAGPPPQWSSAAATSAGTVARGSPPAATTGSTSGEDIFRYIYRYSDILDISTNIVSPW